MDFQLGQLLQPDTDEYAEAAMWCHSNGALINKEQDGTYKISSFEIPTNDKLCCHIRNTRDGYLLQCDMVTNRHRDQIDASLTTTITNSQYLEVLILKQTLRDIPQQAGFPDNVVWPSVPDFLE